MRCAAATDSAPFKGATALSSLDQLLNAAHSSGLLTVTCEVPNHSSDTFTACRELRRQLVSSGLTKQVPAILAKAEQEVKPLQAAVN